VTADELKDLLLARLVRNQGGVRSEWRKRIGQVRLYSVATHPHCNWAIDAAGTRAQIEAIETLVDDLRSTHPILT
jgi:hypothetical protein